MPILPSYLDKIDHPNQTETSGDFGKTTNSGRNTSSALVVSSFTHTENSSGSNCSRRDPELDDVSIKLGLLLASKSAMQLIVNPFVGRLTDRYRLFELRRGIFSCARQAKLYPLMNDSFHRVGYHLPMCAGFSIMTLSTICESTEQTAMT